MPAPSDILRFAQGQLLQSPELPHTNFSGKTVVITGANTGLGFECATQLVKLHVATLVLGCRSIAKGEAARERLLASKDVRTKIHVWQIDMASFDSVISFSERMQKDLPQLNALVANAGISTTEYKLAEGLESTLTVNVVSTFLLAMLAIPRLRKTAVMTNHSSHLSVIGSNVHCFADHAQLQSCPKGSVLDHLSDKTQANMPARYFLSKLIVMQGVRELAKILSPSTVILNCPSPGWCKTELFRQDDGGFWGRNMLKLIGRTADVGARTLTSSIAADKDTHGCYLSECKIKPPSVFVRSPEGLQMQSQLWQELSARLNTISPGLLANLKE